MAEEIKDLIEKIQQEGIKAAEDKAKQIEQEAKAKAEAILQKAQAQSAKIILEANEEVTRRQESAKASIRQAARDLLLSLKKEINFMLERLIASTVSQTLTPSEMAKIIEELVKKFGSQTKDDVLVLLKKEDLEKLKSEFLSRLKEETKKGIILKPSQDISAGFIISFDAGKSHFDFTDKVLAEYLSSFLRPHLNQILNGVIQNK